MSEVQVENLNIMNHRIFISSSTLYNLLTCAEAEAKELKESEGPPVKPGAGKWMRQKTPPDELRPDDERRLLEEEEGVAEEQ